MTPRALLARLLPLLCLLAIPLAVAQGSGPNAVYLPALFGPPAQDSADLVGDVRVWPVSRVVEPDYQPERYVVVLDVSGSMNMNFAGQGFINGQAVQCTQGPPGAPPNQECGRPEYAWPTIEERRIFIAKGALSRLIEEINLPGNAGYDSALPSDQLTIIWYNHQTLASQRFPLTWEDPARADPEALKGAVLVAGSFGGDPYKSFGGTNGAAGLYRARQALDTAPPTVEHQGKTYSYRNEVVFVTDGVQNFFLHPERPDLSGGQSGPQTYPQDHPCRALGSTVIETASCQTTEVGGLFDGRERPITQTIQEAARLKQVATVSVIALAHFDYLGLETVASRPGAYFVISDPAAPGGGGNPIDQALQQVRARAPGAGETCRAVSQGVVAAVDPANLPASPPGGLLGEVILAGEGRTLRAPIVRDELSGALSFRLGAVPAGEYQLRAGLWYRGADGAERLYSRLFTASGALVDQIGLSVAPQAAPIDLGVMELMLDGDPCAGG